MCLQQALAPAWVSQDGTITFTQEIAVTPSIFRGQVANRGGISVTLAIEQLKAFGVLLVAQAEFPPQLSCIRENPGPITECGHPGRIQRMLLASSDRKSVV